MNEFIAREKASQRRRAPSGERTMLKKARAGLAGKEEGTTKDLSQSVLDSSRQIWLAGLGAFSRAQVEGKKVFEGLVKQGEVLETRTRRVAQDTAAAARGVAKAKVSEVKQGVGGTWDKLEHVFEDRVARALSKLGVHTQSDVERLTERVDALSEAVNELIKRAGTPSARRTPAASAARAGKAANRTTAKSAKKTSRIGSRTAK
jgi:poly(hydroxyalkanoate) granule-associated protein